MRVLTVTGVQTCALPILDETVQIVKGLLTSVEVEIVGRQEALHDLHRLVQPPDALAGRRELEAEPPVLLLVPRRPEAQDRKSVEYGQTMECWEVMAAKQA